MHKTNTPGKVASNAGLGAVSKAHLLLERCGRQKGNRWFVRHGARTHFGHGFRSKAEADEWIDAHRRAGLMDWRVGYRFRLRGESDDVLIVNRHGEPLSA